jgi:hypothetical protein
MKPSFNCILNLGSIGSTSLPLCAAVLLLGLGLTGLTARAADGDLSLEAQWVQGSNETVTGGKPVAPEIEGKLKRLPLKWQHYTLLGTQSFTVGKNDAKTVTLGAGCEITVKNLGGERVEMTLAGRGKITQSLAKGQTLVTGGNEENSVVVLRQAD